MTYAICNKRKIKLVMTIHFGTTSNSFFRKSKKARYRILTNGVKINTASAYPIITTVETSA